MKIITYLLLGCKYVTTTKVDNQGTNTFVLIKFRAYIGFEAVLKLSRHLSSAKPHTWHLWTGAETRMRQNLRRCRGLQKSSTRKPNKTKQRSNIPEAKVAENVTWPRKLARQFRGSLLPYFPLKWPHLEARIDSISKIQWRGFMYKVVLPFNFLSLLWKITVQ